VTAGRTFNEPSVVELAEIDAGGEMQQVSKCCRSKHAGHRSAAAAEPAVRAIASGDELSVTAEGDATVREPFIAPSRTRLHRDSRSGGAEDGCQADLRVR
jgi:hypothetical protein